MKTTRYGTFETNSSSTHSLLILSNEEQRLLDNEELYITSSYNYDLISKAEYIEIMTNAMKESEEYDEELTFKENLDQFKQSDSYYDNRWELPCTLDELIELETDTLSYDTETYTSNSGDHIIIHAFYGYNG